LTPTVWFVVIVTGVCAGLLGDALMAILRGVEWLAFDYRHGTFEDAVTHTSAVRRIAALAIAGALAGPGWYALRKAFATKSAELDNQLWAGSPICRCVAACCLRPCPSQLSVQAPHSDVRRHPS